MLSAFKSINIQVGVRENYFKDKFSEIKQTTPQNIKEPRGLQSDNILNELKQVRYESFIISTIMLNQGYRISEAMSIVQNPNKYIKPLSNGDYKIVGVVGKGGKIYHAKTLKHKDFQLIKNMNKIPSKQTFSRDLKILDPNLRAHDFRYQYARNLFEKKVSEVGYDRALKIVSKALNHNRSEITKYYITS